MTDYLSDDVEYLFIHDGAVGSHRFSEVRVRIFSDDPAAALYLRYSFFWLPQNFLKWNHWQYCNVVRHFVVFLWEIQKNGNMKLLYGIHDFIEMLLIQVFFSLSLFLFLFCYIVISLLSDVCFVSSCDQMLIQWKIKTIQQSISRSLQFFIQEIPISLVSRKPLQFSLPILPSNGIQSIITLPNKLQFTFFFSFSDVVTLCRYTAICIWYPITNRFLYLILPIVCLR